MAADRATLTEFCDRWFNSKLPPAVAYFRPTLPVVFCTVLTYSDMSEDDRWRLGTHAQNEVYFMVPLDRLRWRGEREELVERGVTTPFIFVDNAYSVIVGRQRHGFPKELCAFDDGSSEAVVPWAADAGAYLDVRVWQPGVAGRALTPFLRIVRNTVADRGAFDDATGRRVPQASRTGTRSDVLWWTQTLLRELPHIGASLSVERIGDLWSALTGELPVNAYNLRQLPSPSDGRTAYYQDLIRFRMRLRRLQDVRLFQESPSLASPFSLVIERRAAQPVVDILGLRVRSRERRPTGSGDAVYDVIDVPAPFYLQGDIVLEESSRLCWQFRTGAWTAPAEPNVPAGTYRRRGATDSGGRLAFDNYLGTTSALLHLDRPARTVVDVKHIILSGNSAAIEETLRASVPRDCSLQVQPVSIGGVTPIRLTLTRSRARTARESDGLMWLDGRTLSISVPVRYLVDGEPREALFRLYDFLDNPFHQILLAEAYGARVDPAEFINSRFDWFSATQSVRQHQVVQTHLIERSAQEARVQMAPWLYVVSTGDPKSVATRPPALVDLERGLARIQPMLVLGGVQDPASPAGWIEQRISLAAMDGQPVVATQRIEDGRRYFVGFRYNEKIPLVQLLGLEADASMTIDLPVNHQLGPMTYVEVSSVFEGAEHPEIKGVEVLWSSRR